MTYRVSLTAAALAFGLAATTASAQPYGKGGNYSMAPAQKPPATEAAPMRDCDCPMMKDGSAGRAPCMTMMPENVPPAPKGGSAG